MLTLLCTPGTGTFLLPASERMSVKIHHYILKDSTTVHYVMVRYLFRRHHHQNLMNNCMSIARIHHCISNQSNTYKQEYPYRTGTNQVPCSRPRSSGISLSCTLYLYCILYVLNKTTPFSNTYGASNNHYHHDYQHPTSIKNSNRKPRN